MKRYFFLLVLCLGLMSCTHPTWDRGPSNQIESSQPRHIIIAVHGIGGDLTTWGDMGAILREHLGQINPNFAYEFHSFVYPTGQGDKTTFDFGHDNLGNYIKNTVFGNGKPDIQPNDRITFVAHSQGGLVATIWYIDTLVALSQSLDNTKAKNPDLEKLVGFAKYAKNVDAIVTLGTPFWGSKLATRLSDEEKYDFSGMAGLNDPKELEEMSFGSNTIYEFRRTSMAIGRTPALKKLITARMVNIAGIFPFDRKKIYHKSNRGQDFKFYINKLIMNVARYFSSKKGFGGERYESDFAVLAPSSRIDFLYAADTSFSKDVKPLGAKDFQWAEVFPGNFKWILTESIHTQASMKYNVGMAAIPEYCLNPETCVHPTYRHILQEVAHCDVNPCDQVKAKELFSKLAVASEENENLGKNLQEALQGFTVDVVLRVPKMMDKDGKEIDYDLEDVRFRNSPGMKFSKYEARPNLDEIPKTSLSKNDFFKRAVNLFQNRDQRVQGTDPLVVVYLGQDREYLSRQVSWEEISHMKKSHRDLRLTLTGSIRPSPQGQKQLEAYKELIKEGIEIPMEFKLPGLVPRKVGVKVMPGVSSFLELQLIPAQSN